MISKKIIAISIASITIAWLSYWYNFNFLLSYKISSKPEDWGVLGDYIGGILNPILTFITIILLVNSLNLQKEANKHLESEIASNEHNEKIHTFESRFFQMIDSQKNSFNKFTLIFLENGSPIKKYSSSAVCELETLIFDLKDAKATDEQIKHAIQSLDSEDEIYSVIRVFCLIAKTINKKITKSDGFTTDEQLEYYETLINFTDYSLIKLVLICMKHLDYPVFNPLNNCNFYSALKNVGADSYLESV